MSNKLKSSASAIKNEISLTLMIVSFLILVVAGISQVFKKTDTTGPFMELFMSCGALYFGRKWVKSSASTEETKEP